MRILLTGAESNGLGAAQALCARLRAEGHTGRVIPLQAFGPVRVAALLPGGAALLAGGLQREMAAGRWEAVVAAHPLAAQTVTILRTSGRLAVPALGLVAEYRWSPGWRGTLCDEYALSHVSLLEEGIRMGLPLEKLHATGVPVYDGPGPGRADARFALGVPRGGALVLVPHARQEQIDALLRLPDFHPWVAALCVHEGQRAKLIRCYARQPRVLVRDFGQPPELWLDACNVLLTGPCALLLARAAARRVPMVLTGSGPQARLFADDGMCLCVRGAEAGARAARLLCQNAGRAQAMRQAQQLHANPGAAGAVCARLTRWIGR